MNVSKRNGILYLRFWINGKEYKRSTGLTDTPANRAHVKAKIIPIVEAQIIAGNFGKKRDTTVAFYIDCVLRERENTKSYRHLKNRAKAIKQKFGERDIASIKPSEIREWIYSLDIKAGSVSGLLTPFRLAFGLAIDDEVIGKSPLERVSIPKDREPFSVEPFSKREVELMLNKARGGLRHFLAVALFTGMRSGEILALKWADIDLVKKVIRVERQIRDGEITTPKTKSGVRTIPLFDALIPYLEEMPRVGEWLFHKQDGNSLYTRQAYITSGEWRLFLENLGIKHRRLYETRHTFASHLLADGKLSVMEVARILGHANASMVLRVYGKYIEDNSRIKRDLNPFD